MKKYSPKLTYTSKSNLWGNKLCGPLLCHGTVAKFAVVDKHKPLWVGISDKRPKHNEWAKIKAQSDHPPCLSGAMFVINRDPEVHIHFVYHGLYLNIRLLSEETGEKWVYIWLEQEE